MSDQRDVTALPRRKPMGLIEGIENLTKGYDLAYALMINRHGVMDALYALEQLVAELETNSESGAPDYAHKALVWHGI